MAVVYHGKDTVFLLEDSAASTLRDLSVNLTSVTLARQNVTHDSTGFGATGHAFVGGLTNGTIQIQGFWDDTASTGTATVLDSLLGLGTTTIGWEYGPEGNTAGDVKYSGECVLQSLDHSSPVADLVTFSATLQISGAVTKGTFAE
jgi:hypothetical protein